MKRHNILNLLKYITVFLAIVFVIWAIFFHNFRSVSLLNISDLYRSYARQTELLTDSIDDLVKSYGKHVFQSEPSRLLRSPGEHTNSEMIYALRELSEYASGSDFVESINIYNPAKEILYTTSPLLLSVDGVDPDEFTGLDIRRIYREFDGSEFIRTLFHRNDRNGMLDGFYYIFFDTLHSKSENACMMILSIYPKWYLSRLTSLDSQNNIMLFDSRNELMYSKVEHDIAYKDIIAKITDQDSGYITGMVNRDKKVFFISDFKPFGWKLVSVVDEKDCLPHLYRLRDSITIIFIVAGLVLVLMLLLVFIFIYDPYERIRNKLNDMQDTSDSSRKLSEDELLNAIIDENVTNKYMTDFGLLLGGEEIALEGFTPPYVLGISAIRDRDMLQGLLEPACRKSVITDYLHEGQVFLACPNDTMQEMEQDMLVKERHFLALSSPYDDLGDTALHYRRLSELFDMKFTMDSIICMEDELDGRTSDTTGEDALISEMFSAMRNRKPDEVMDTSDRFFDALAGLDAVGIRHSLKNLEIEIGKSARELGMPVSVGVPDIDGTMKEAVSMKSIRDRYLPLIMQIEAGYKQVREANETRIAAQIENILDKNYTRYDFTTIEIAEAIGRNLNYLSRVYKDTYGISISNSIMKKRVDTARTLLLNTDANVEDIALKLGFENVKYFYVIFKKHVGMTPLQYRKKCRQD